MNDDMSDNNTADNMIVSVIKRVLPDCSETECADILTHISEQLKGFNVISSVDTRGVQPLFDVREEAERCGK